MFAATGFVAGIFFIRILSFFVPAMTGFLSAETLQGAFSGTFQVRDFLYYVIEIRFRSFLFWTITSMTVLGKGGLAVFALKKGFFQGMLCMGMLLTHKLKGILYYIVTLVPQCFVALPWLVMFTCWGFEVHQELFSYKKYEKGQRKKLILKEWGILAVLLLLECWLEAYVNSFLTNHFLGNL